MEWPRPKRDPTVHRRSQFAAWGCNRAGIDGFEGRPPMEQVRGEVGAVQVRKQTRRFTGTGMETSR